MNSGRCITSGVGVTVNCPGINITPNLIIISHKKLFYIKLFTMELEHNYIIQSSELYWPSNYERVKRQRKSHTQIRNQVV